MIICIQRIASYNQSAPSNLINPPSTRTISERAPGTTNQWLRADRAPIRYLVLIMLMCHRHRCCCREYGAHKEASIRRHCHIWQKESRGSGPGCVLGETRVPLGAGWLFEVVSRTRRGNIGSRGSVGHRTRTRVGLNRPSDGDYKIGSWNCWAFRYSWLLRI